MTRRGMGVTSWFLPSRGIGAVLWAAEAGFGHVHIDMTDVATCKPAELRSQSRERGITLAGLAVDSLETIGVYGTRARNAVDHALATAPLLDVSYVYLPSFGSAYIRSFSDLRATANLLRYAADQAQDEGIVIATENSLPAPALSLLFDFVDRDAVELLFDTQNLPLRGINPLEVVSKHGDRIRSFAHVKDGMNELGASRLGAGTSAIGRSIDALLSHGFTGIFIIESDYRSASRAAVEHDSTWLLKISSECGAQILGHQ